jgi:hypothetical protein
MKKSIFAILGGVFILVACQQNTGASLGRISVIGVDTIDRNDITFFIDTKTGCQYMLTADYSDVITPVLNKDGKPYCEK